MDKPATPAGHRSVVSAAAPSAVQQAQPQAAQQQQQSQHPRSVSVPGLSVAAAAAAAASKVSPKLTPSPPPTGVPRESPRPASVSIHRDVKDLESELQMYKELKVAMEAQREEEIARITAEREDLRGRLDRAVSEISSLQDRAVTRRSLDVPRGAAPQGQGLLRPPRPRAMVPGKDRQQDSAAYVSSLEARVAELQHALTMRDDEERASATATRLEDTTRLADDLARRVKELEEQLEQERTEHGLERASFATQIDSLRRQVDHKRHTDRKRTAERIQALEKEVSEANARVAELQRSVSPMAGSESSASAEGGAASPVATTPVPAASPGEDKREKKAEEKKGFDKKVSGDGSVQTMRERQATQNDYEARIKDLEAQLARAQAETAPERIDAVCQALDDMPEDMLRRQAKAMAGAIAEREATEVALRRQLALIARDLDELKRAQLGTGGLNLPYLRNAFLKYIESDDKKTILPALAEVFGFTNEERQRALAHIGTFKMPGFKVR